MPCRKPPKFVACSNCALSCGAVEPEGVKGWSHGWRVSAQRDAEPVEMGLFCCARPRGTMDCHPPPRRGGRVARSRFHGFRSPLANSTRGYSRRPRWGRTSQVFYRARQVLFVPEGPPKIAKRFIAGSRVRELHSVPSGRLRCIRSLAFNEVVSIVPTGLDPPTCRRSPIPEGLGYQSVGLVARFFRRSVVSFRAWLPDL